MGCAEGRGKQVTGSLAIRTWVGAGLNLASSGFFASFLFRPEWWLNGAGPFMLQVGEDA